MDEALVSSAVGEVLKKAFSLIGEEISLAWEFKRDLEKLGKKLEMIQALMLDAGRMMQVKMKYVELWLNKLEAIADDADDVFDEVAYEVLRKNVEIQNKVKNKVHNFFSNSNPILFRFKMARRIRDINLSLAEIYREANEIGLKPVELINTSTVEPREIRLTHPRVDDSEVVGRDKEVSKIVDVLVNSNNEKDLSVIAIVGMPGLGKTTLAQKIYNNENVVRQFSHRIWVYVSPEFDVIRILNEMVQSLTGTNPELSNVEAIVKQIQENVRGKKYLLVLDDVWNEIPEKWDFMKNSLIPIDGSTDIKIVVTTRSQVVASIVRSSLTHHLAQLPEEDSWMIFKKRAFADGGPRETSNLVKIGKIIVKRCKGVPLAINTLGGSMQSKMHEREWLSVRDSEMWNSPTNEYGIMPALFLSFNHLPSPSLKQCFAYCSIFPKDTWIEKKKLIELWMAQGYLHPPQGSNIMMEDIGDYYFNILLRKFLLQDVRKDEYGNVIGCKMHDLVHDLTLLISNNHIKTWKESMPQPSKASVKKLRTLFWMHRVSGNMLMNFKCLRVLVLSGSGVKKLPSSIGQLIHLRYIDISETSITTLPDSITNLYNLQTLRFFVWWSWLEFPKEFRKLVSLRHLYIRDIQKNKNCMPMSIGQLTCLQTLPFFVVSHEKGRRFEELGCLVNLRGELKIYGLECVRSMEEAQKANLSRNSNIHELIFQWAQGRDENNDEDVLEGLEPHGNLENLTINNYKGNKFASWMTDHASLLHNLVKIELIDCHNCKQVPTLGHLHSLKVVHIVSMLKIKCIGSEFYGQNHSDEGVFPELRELALENMPNLVEWVEAVPPLPAGKVFPRLEKLTIEGCSQLINAPSHFASVQQLRVKEIKSNTALRNISSKLIFLTSLEMEDISSSELNLVMKELWGNNRSLNKLSIGSCNELFYLPDELLNLVSLERLTVSMCPNLLSVPDGIQSLRLRYFCISGSEKLKCLPKWLGTLMSLEKLEIESCPDLTKFPDIRSLKSLGSLSVARCQKLIVWPEGLHRLIGLQELEIGGFSEDLDYFPCPSAEDIQQLISLRTLTLIGWPNLKSLPVQLQQLTGLEVLSIEDFNGLDALPEWLENLSSLEDLSVRGCEKLMSLPTVEAMRRLSKLRYVCISNCPLLKERCRRGSPEWYKIAHIPDIWYDVINSTPR